MTDSPPRSPPRPLALRQIEGPGLREQVWPLSNPFRMGRASSNELELPDPGVSRRHLSIEHDARGWMVRDCGARRGAQLNGLQLDDSAIAMLHAGDVLSVGPWRFRVDALGPDLPSGSADSATRISVVGGLGHLARQRLELLLRYASEIAAAENETTLAESMAEHALLGSGYTRASVLWRREGRLELACQRPALSIDASWQFHASLVESAAAGEPARLESESPVPAGAGSGARRAHRALCVPLVFDGVAQAFLYLESDRSSAQRHADAPTFCHALVRLAALALANLHRLRNERRLAAVAADLERAREVQQRLLPPAEGRHDALAYSLRLHPGRIVAGDVADVFAIGDGRVVAVLGDVSGAGLGAGLVMASVQSFLRAGFAHDSDPACVVARLNVHLCAQAGDGQFVSLWLGVFDAVSGECRFVDAGHGHVLHVRAGKAAPLPARGSIPLGIDTQAQFAAESLRLDREEILVLYSDGVIEQQASNGEARDAQDLARCLDAARSPAQAVELAWQALMQAAGDAPPDDDATVLALGLA